MINILTKKQNCRLWQSGEFGNKLRAWQTVDEWRESGFAGLIVLRLRSSNTSWNPCLYNLSPHAIDRAVDCWLNSGIAYHQIMVNEAAPDSDVILQGEYLNDPGLCWGYFLHSRSRAHLRDALRLAPIVTQGLRSNLIIQQAMTPSSYEDWQMLIDRYPDHVFEVSIYDRCLGDIPNRNALVWEIRKY
jgi:hypothetical protein